MESSYTIDLTPACCCGCCCEVDCPTSGTLCLPTGLTFTYGEGTDCFAALDGMTASVGYYDGAGPPWKYNIFGTFGDYVINLSAEWSCLGGCLGLDGAIEVQGPDDCCYGCRPPDGGGHTWIGPLSIYNTGRGGGIPTNNQTCEVVSCSPLNIRVALGPLAGYRSPGSTVVTITANSDDMCQLRPAGRMAMTAGLDPALVLLPEPR